MRYLVRDERVMLGYWLAKEKISLRTIARRLNRAYSTITDEVRKVGGDYLAEIAQKMTRENLKRRGRKTTNEQNLDLLDFIELVILTINWTVYFSLYLVIRIFDSNKKFFSRTFSI